MMLRKIFHPILRQGGRGKGPFFEGWYYKLVSADRMTVLSLIPGYSLSREDSHGFLQYILAVRGTVRSGYVRFSLEDFDCREDPFVVRIGGNRFSETEVAVDLVDEGFSLSGTVRLEGFTEIRRSLFSPNIMGFFAYLPGMECNHGVLSLDHGLEGSLSIGGTLIRFDGGRGYLEKDWGRSFPKRYVWMQSNHFSEAGRSLFLSVAEIPFGFLSFRGFIGVFHDGEQEHRFATYNGSRCRLILEGEGRVELLLENRRARLRIRGRQLGNAGLVAPVLGRMEKSIKEGIGGILELSFLDKQTGRLLEDSGHPAGLEIVGYGK